MSSTQWLKTCYGTQLLNKRALANFPVQNLKGFTAAINCVAERFAFDLGQVRIYLKTVVLVDAASKHAAIQCDDVEHDVAIWAREQYGRRHIFKCYFFIVPKPPFRLISRT